MFLGKRWLFKIVQEGCLDLPSDLDQDKSGSRQERESDASKKGKAFAEAQTRGFSLSTLISLPSLMSSPRFTLLCSHQKSPWASASSLITSLSYNLQKKITGSSSLSFFFWFLAILEIQNDFHLVTALWMQRSSEWSVRVSLSIPALLVSHCVEDTAAVWLFQLSSLIIEGLCSSECKKSKRLLERHHSVLG